MIVFLWLCAIRCQITNVAQPQPVLKVSEGGVLKFCCGNASTSACLLEHLVLSQRTHITSTICMVSYATANILESYAVYAFAINSAYADHHRYALHLTSPETGHEFELMDQRWNKIQIMIDYLTNTDCQYVVWLDADLIFLDMGMKLEQVIESYPDTDLIVSSDSKVENGVINTGR